MASKADGTIYINTAIETDGFTAGGKEVEAAARRMAKSVSGIGASAKIALQKQTDAFVKQNQLFSQQEQKVEELKQKQEEIASQKNETAEYKNLSSEMEKLDSEMDAVIQKQKDLISTGFSEDEAYRTVEDDLERIGSAIDRIIEKQKQMRESGTAYQTPDTSAIDQKVFAAELKLEQMHTALGTSYESLTQKAQKYEEQAMEAAAKAQAAERKNEERLANMNRKLEETRAKEVQAIVEAERLKEIGKNAEISDQHIVDLNKELTQLKARQEELSRAGLSFGYEEFDQISVRVAEIMQALKEYEDALNNTKKQSFDFSSAQDKLKKAMSGLTSSVKKITLSLIGLSGSTKKANGSLGSSLKTIIKYSLGIRGLCALFDKIRNAATDGFSNLAQYSGATNASISS